MASAKKCLYIVFVLSGMSSVDVNLVVVDDRNTKFPLYSILRMSDYKKKSKECPFSALLFIFLISK